MVNEDSERMTSFPPTSVSTLQVLFYGQQLMVPDIIILLHWGKFFWGKFFWRKRHMDGDGKASPSAPVAKASTFPTTGFSGSG